MLIRSNVRLVPNSSAKSGPEEPNTPKQDAVGGYQHDNIAALLYHRVNCAEHAPRVKNMLEYFQSENRVKDSFAKQPVYAVSITYSKVKLWMVTPMSSSPGDR